MPRLQLPDGVLGMADRDDAWAEWVARLPTLAEGLLDEWGLREDGKSMHGYTSLVLPVVTAAGERAVLKVTFDGDEETEHEGLALQHWGGDGAVRLLRADPLRRALLLERLHHEDLTELPDIEACEVVAGFYPRLHKPALPQLRTLTSYVDRWLDGLAGLGRELPVPRRMVEQAMHLGRSLVTDEGSTGVIIHGDLHYENVLAADRAPWLVIDPQPMSGDPHYEPPPLLWNRWDEMADDVRGGIRRRFHAVVDAAGLDEPRTRDWTIVRMVIDASWSALDAQRADRPLASSERAWITQCIAIVKAVQE